MIIIMYKLYWLDFVLFHFRSSVFFIPSQCAVHNVQYMQLHITCDFFSVQHDEIRANEIPANRRRIHQRIVHTSSQMIVSYTHSFTTRFLSLSHTLMWSNRYPSPNEQLHRLIGWLTFGFRLSAFLPIYFWTQNWKHFPTKWPSIQ